MNIEKRRSRRAVDRMLAPLIRFMAIEAASGVVLLFSAGVALALANSPWSEAFASFWHLHLRIGIGAWKIDESLLHWINDGLMTVFFFVVGLEIKRELIEGELHDPRKAALPLIAALGGMIAPAILYLFLIGSQPSGRSGWGIPMATDIAFAVGFLALLGERVPSGLKILLLVLAIVDDIGAILVIAFFYSTGVSVEALSLTAAGLGLIIICRRLGVRGFGIYLVIGFAIWIAMFHSGIHPTVAGVLLGLLTSAKRVPGQAESHTDSKNRLRETSAEVLSPLEQLETTLHPWVAFLILPLFALANAGVAVDIGAITHPIAWSVAMGLVVGKPVGIILFSWLAVRIGLASLPEGGTWKAIIGTGCLAGIGFTMSLFIANLALEEHLLSAGKIGTILGSAISAILGVGLLFLFLPGSGRASSETLSGGVLKSACAHLACHSQISFG